MRHLQLAAFHRKSQLAFDQIERVLAEHLVPPALQHRQIAHPCGERFHLVGAGQQARGDVDFAGADFQQQFQQIGHQRAFLAQRGAVLDLFGHFILGQRLGIGQHLHQPLADVVVFPRRRQPAHLGQIALILGRVAGNIGQGFIAHDPPARDVLVLRFALAPSGQRLHPAQHLRIAARLADTLPRHGGIGEIVRRIGQLFHLGIQP